MIAPALDNPGFQKSVSDAMLKATLLRGREGTPMPSIEALGLKEKDADDLVDTSAHMSIRYVQNATWQAGDYVLRAKVRRATESSSYCIARRATRLD